MTRTGIEWCDRTWNPVRGCSRVSEGCRNCYAERFAARFSTHSHQDGDIPGGVFAHFASMTPAGPRWTGRVELIPSKLGEPLRWRKPSRVFVNSMSDLFHESLVGWKEPGNFSASGFEALREIAHVMRQAHRHTFQILTKRPHVMADMWPRIMLKLNISEPLPNVHLGVSVEDQATADERIPILLDTPAALRFVSAEPLLGPVDFSPYLPMGPEHDPRGDHWCAACARWKGAVDLIIAGGESGPGARPCDIGWIRSIVGQCKAAGVPVFVKQLGARPTMGGYDRSDPVLNHEHEDVRLLKSIRNRKGADPAEWPEDLRVREVPS